MQSDLRLHASHSKVNKNKPGLQSGPGTRIRSYSVRVRVCFMGNLALPDFTHKPKIVTQWMHLHIHYLGCVSDQSRPTFVQNHHYTGISYSTNPSEAIDIIYLV